MTFRFFFYWLGGVRVEHHTDDPNRAPYNEGMEGVFEHMGLPTSVTLYSRNSPDEPEAFVGSFMPRKGGPT